MSICCWSTCSKSTWWRESYSHSERLCSVEKKRERLCSRRPLHYQFRYDVVFVIAETTLRLSSGIPPYILLSAFLLSFLSFTSFPLSLSFSALLQQGISSYWHSCVTRTFYRLLRTKPPAVSSRSSCSRETFPRSIFLRIYTCWISLVGPLFLPTKELKFTHFFHMYIKIFCRRFLFYPFHFLSIYSILLY